jgi:hypothetical protein
MRILRFQLGVNREPIQFFLAWGMASIASGAMAPANYMSR